MTELLPQICAIRDISGKNPGTGFVYYVCFVGKSVLRVLCVKTGRRTEMLRFAQHDTWNLEPGTWNLKLGLA